MLKASIMDTTISDYNLGNIVIMDAVNNILQKICPKTFFYRLPYMEITQHTLSIVRKTDFIFFGGGNILSSHMERDSTWGINPINCWDINNIILFGVGWRQYQQSPNLYSKLLMRKVLTKKFLHSVRDSYTKAKLIECGINNIIVTGCPSIWSLNTEHCQTIPKIKSNIGIVTLTDYAKNPARDLEILRIVQRCYKKVFLWPQGAEDISYAKELCLNNVTILNPSLLQLNKFLSENLCDYIGTRLHAGIRSLQLSKRTIIIGIDNRAIEMAKDFGLPVIEQNDLKNLEEFINSRNEFNIKIPIPAIQKWESQFNTPHST